MRGQEISWRRRAPGSAMSEVIEPHEGSGVCARTWRKRLVSRVIEPHEGSGETALKIDVTALGVVIEPHEGSGVRAGARRNRRGAG